MEQSSNFQRYTYLFGRLLLALLFISAAIKNLANLEAVIDSASNAIPGATVIVPTILLFECLVGIMLIVDSDLSRKLAVGMGIYCLTLCFLFYPYWNFEGTERIVQMNYFWKTLGLGGGMFLYAGCRRPGKSEAECAEKTSAESTA